MRVKTGLLLLLLSGSWLFAQTDPKKGCVEINVHYSGWSLNLLGDLIEKKAGEVLEDNLRDWYLDEVREHYPDAVEVSYSQTIKFDSTGKNLGAEFRWYPKGYGGSFSIGVSVESSTMKVSFPEVTSQMTVVSPSYPGRVGRLNAEAVNTGAEIKPLSFNFSFRWDIKPSWRVHPYFTFGLGFFTVRALERGKLHAGYVGTFVIPGVSSDTYSDSLEKTVKQAIDESDQDISLPPLLPILQLNLGIKAEVTRNLHLLVDAGVWNGFLLRGGVSFRL